MKTVRTLISWFRKIFKLKISLREERQRQRLTEAEYWARCLEDVRSGRRPDPLMMTEMERHQAGKEFSRRLKWSKDFAYRMRTPLLRQLQETGKAVNLIGGDDFATPEVYTTEEEIQKLAHGKQALLEDHD